MTRLGLIATILTPCPAPDIAAGYCTCPCGLGCCWPCPSTMAAWLARGLDPGTETNRAIAHARAALRHGG
jgi:hypothetical protein